MSQKAWGRGGRESRLCGEGALRHLFSLPEAARACRSIPRKAGAWKRSAPSIPYEAGAQTLVVSPSRSHSRTELAAVCSPGPTARVGPEANGSR